MNAGFNFDLSGGEPCLDFVNTVDGRRAPERSADNLKDYAALLAFSAQAGVLSPAEMAGLARIASQHPGQAVRALAAGKELRESLYGIFSSIAAGKRADTADLSLLNRYVQASLHGLRLEPAGRGFAWKWQDDDELNAPLWRIAKSAADLLSSPEVHAIRECAEGSCGWLFVDRSRNRTRRWCDMKICGNRVKVRRHYGRVTRSRRRSSAEIRG